MKLAFVCTFNRNLQLIVKTIISYFSDLFFSKLFQINKSIKEYGKAEEAECYIQHSAPSLQLCLCSKRNKILVAE